MAIKKAGIPGQESTEILRCRVEIHTKFGRDWAAENEQLDL